MRLGSSQVKAACKHVGEIDPGCVWVGMKERKRMYVFKIDVCVCV
jgi:hypothetical protein